MAEKKKLDLALIFGEPKGKMKEKMKEKMSEPKEEMDDESESEDGEEEDEETSAIKDIWQAIKDDDEEAFSSAIKLFKNC